MTTNDQKPSYLELDRLALSKQESLPEAEDTALPAYAVEHLRRLREPVVAPGWARALAATEGAAPSATRVRPPWYRGRRRFAVPLAWAAGVVMAGAAAILVGVLPDKEPAAYTGIKGGGPSVGVYLQRNNRVLLWDGDAPLQPGDRIRLQVAPDHYAFVSVLDANVPDGRVLYRNRVVPHVQVALPTAWKVDARGTGEHLVVLFSDGPITPAGARAALRSTVPPKGMFRLELKLPKIASPQP